MSARPSKQAPRLFRPLFEQFSKPSGWLGQIAGRLMAKGVEDDCWLVNLVDIRPDDRLLEIGFGPGVALELIAGRATAGFVAGIDPSEVMLRQATRRNWKVVQQGRVELRQGTVVALPYADGSFTKVLSLHSVYFWASVEAGLRQIRRVLRSGGRLAIGVRVRLPDAGRLNPSRYGLTEDQLADIQSLLESLGFREVETHRRTIGRETIAAILAGRE